NFAEQSEIPADSATGPATANDISNQRSTEQSGVRMSINFDLKGQNSACSFNIRQMTLYEILNGVKAPAKKLFAVFDLELTNMLPEQDVVVYPDGGQHPARWINQASKKEKIIKAVPAYEIGDISRHLFLRWNDDPATPCSPAGWLTADPLAGFARNNLVLSPGKPAAGKVAFLVSDEHGLSNGAIDYYDSNYGHLSLVIAGKMEPAALRAATLPESPAGSLGKAFTLKITGVEDHPAPLFAASAGKHLVWRLVDFVIESQVQALLDIDPRTRMHLVIPTEAGPVRRPLSMVTGLLPAGFLYRSKLTPGSANNFRQAFLLPAELAATASGTICIELTGDNSYINLNSAETFSNAAVERSWNAEGNGLKVKINTQGRLASINNQKGEWLVVDATVADLPDGSGTRLDKLLFLGRADLKEHGFMLNSGQRMLNTSGNKAEHKGLGTFADAKEAAGNQTRIYPEGINNTLMFAANDSSAVPDGQELRFVAIFRVPAKGEYLLAAEGMPLAEALASSEPKELPNWILAANDEVVPTLPTVFEQQLAAKLKQLAIVESFKPAAKETTQIVDPDGNICESPCNLRPPVILPESASNQGNIVVEVIIETESTAEGAAAQAGAAASALSGGGRQTRNLKVVSSQLAVADVCKTPFEIVYYEDTDRAGAKLLKARVVGIWGGNEGRDAVDLKNWQPVKEIITFGCKGMNLLRFERALDKNGLKDRVHSIALAIPDLSEEQTADLQKRWTAARSERAPDHISLWQWFAHARLAGFIAAQSAHEKELVDVLGVHLSRENSPRIMVLTGALNGSKTFEARLDLLNIQPVVSGDNQAVDAFRIAAGIFVSALEAEIMSGKGVFQFWGKNRLQIIADSGNQKKAWLKFAASRGVSERAIKAISTTRSVVLFPETPAMINEQPFWAWLEINPKTWETIGVLETGERGAFVSEAIVQALVPDGSGLALGFWKGVETSVWGMSAFILQGDSTAQAAANTRKLMGELSEQLAKFSDSIEVSIGDLSVDLVSTKVTLAGFSSEKTYSPWEGYKGFVTGFKMGSSFYLSRVKKTAGN
ncbi:MAG TPA: hypothetical protein DCG57_02150, partial [Candidatus Riflebacteria bacterium]|nr:hypothetical protein [Candidatus Riflebacteria bacterium]